MTVELALRTKLARAEETIEDLTRKLDHAQSQRKLATIRMQQAEDTMRGIVWQLRECVGCSKRRARAACPS